MHQARTLTEAIAEIKTEKYHSVISSDENSKNLFIKDILISEVDIDKSNPTDMIIRSDYSLQHNEGVTKDTTETPSVTDQSDTNVKEVVTDTIEHITTSNMPSTSFTSDFHQDLDNVTEVAWDMFDTSYHSNKDTTSSTV